MPPFVSQETQDEEELNIAPKKANWDLKRDVEKKLEKLNRRTQRAIVEIIRERMAEVRKLASLQQYGGHWQTRRAIRSCLIHCSRSEHVDVKSDSPSPSLALSPLSFAAVA